MATEHAKRPSATKSGPGRYHADGMQRMSPPKPPRAGMDFVQHKASPEKALRRANVKALGRRQSIKAAKRARREAAPESA